MYAGSTALDKPQTTYESVTGQLPETRRDTETHRDIPVAEPVNEQIIHEPAEVEPHHFNSSDDELLMNIDLKEIELLCQQKRTRDSDNIDAASNREPAEGATLGDRSNILPAEEIPEASSLTSSRERRKSLKSLLSKHRRRSRSRKTLDGMDGTSEGGKLYSQLPTAPPSGGNALELAAKGTSDVPTTSVGTTATAVTTTTTVTEPVITTVPSLQQTIDRLNEYWKVQMHGALSEVNELRNRLRAVETQGEQLRTDLQITEHNANTAKTDACLAKINADRAKRKSEKAYALANKGTTVDPDGERDERDVSPTAEAEGASGGAPHGSHSGQFDEFAAEVDHQHDGRDEQVGDHHGNESRRNHHYEQSHSRGDATRRNQDYGSFNPYDASSYHSYNLPNSGRNTDGRDDGRSGRRPSGPPDDNPSGGNGNGGDQDRRTPPRRGRRSPFGEPDPVPPGRAAATAGNGNPKNYGVKYEKFLGKDDDWLAFRQNFENITDIYGHDDQLAKRLLVTRMSKDALYSVTDLDPRDARYPTLTSFLDAYEARFMPAAATALAQTRYEQSIQQKTETVQQWHNRARELFRRAYPAYKNVWATDIRLINKFAIGLRSAGQKVQVIRSEPRTYREALVAAEKEQGVIERITADPMKRRGMLEHDQFDSIGAMQPEATCKLCGMRGHYVINCRKLDYASKLVKRSISSRPTKRENRRSKPMKKKSKFATSRRTPSNKNRSYRFSNKRYPRKGRRFGKKSTNEFNRGRKKNFRNLSQLVAQLLSEEDEVPEGEEAEEPAGTEEEEEESEPESETESESGESEDEDTDIPEKDEEDSEEED